ncbi:thiamine pyrophosphate-binding protein [Exiguobacterium sp. KKBO11]|uniref:acetolactate synthase large subunit n=1 Tax=Exiguobacterium sp. KKBO11 TaxID=1805000 RepID=UPI0007D75496|nr:acetolactate synthase large subunit [Exiguobacterium sp. KKBO11]OAI85140.1 thiamine pyrophosphate-binding protein [Exiguobacterium sp. KKBO11]
MNAADWFVQCLEAEGVTHIFGVPGEENITLLESLSRSSITFITTRHETNAAFMAAMFGRLSGRPGVCLSTLGPGATNMMTGIASATMDHSPVVAITGQGATARQHKASHQMFDLVDLYRPVTKSSTSVLSAEVIPEIVRRAFAAAKSEKPGATHISFPEDIAKQERDQAATPLQQDSTPTHLHSLTIDDPDALRLIERAKRPVIIAGFGIHRQQALDAFRAFVEKLQAPVVETMMGKGAISSHHPLAAHTIGLPDVDYNQRILDASDLIITVGYDITELPPQKWNPKKTPIVHLDTNPHEIDAYYPVVANLVGPLVDMLTVLTPLLPERAWNDWQQDRDKLRDEIQETYSFALPLHPQSIVRELERTVGEDGMVFSDVGAHKVWLARHYQTTRPNQLFISNGFASMGYGLSSALAAKLLYPDRRIVCAAGDGAFLMNGQDLETAVRLKLPLVVLIWRDGTYGLIEWKQQQAFGRSSYITFDNPDLVQLAHAFGALGLRVGEHGSLAHCLDQAFASDGPVLIDCPVDYRENLKLSERLRTYGG